MKMVGGPKSFSGKDGKGGRWETDSSQKKIDFYFKGIGATEGGNPMGIPAHHKYQTNSNSVVCSKLTSAFLSL